MERNIYKIGKELFITSDEKPRQEEWCLDLDTNTVFKIGNWKTDRAKKIIITDNKDLIADGVQKIDDEFLEWFVKNPSCEFVETLFHYPIICDEGDYSLNLGYWTIIIPKEEANKETLEEAYLNKLIDEANKEFTLDKKLAKEVAIKFSKWQQEQDKKLYSEEDLEKAYKDGGRNEYDFINKYHCKARISFDKWFEKFKKK